MADPQGNRTTRRMSDLQVRLLHLATAFRDAVERCDREAWPIGFESFPRGACGACCDLLGVYLSAEGFPLFKRVGGANIAPSDPYKGDTHAWLEGYGLVVDVTADQFGSEFHRVIVARGSPLQGRYAEDRQEGLPTLDGTFEARALHRALADIRAEIARTPTVD